MTETDIRGLCPNRFATVRDAFEANFNEGSEQGVRFALAIDGEIVIDLIGGTRDRARELPFDETTLTPVFSTTKAMASLMIARLVDQEKLWWDQPVADTWPEFGQAGKADITVEQALSHQEGLCGLAGPM